MMCSLEHGPPRYGGVPGRADAGTGAHIRPGGSTPMCRLRLSARPGARTWLHGFPPFFGGGGGRLGARAMGNAGGRPRPVVGDPAGYADFRAGGGIRHVAYAETTPCGGYGWGGPR